MLSRKALLLVSALLSASTVGGCATTGSLGTDSNLVVPCELLAPFKWSHKDTKESQRQAIAYNAIGKNQCKWEGHSVRWHF